MSATEAGTTLLDGAALPTNGQLRAGDQTSIARTRPASRSRQRGSPAPYLMQSDPVRSRYHCPDPTDCIFEPFDRPRRLIVGKHPPAIEPGTWDGRSGRFRAE